jgi:hypothetical protein
VNTLGGDTVTETTQQASRTTEVVETTTTAVRNTATRQAKRTVTKVAAAAAPTRPAPVGDVQQPTPPQSRQTTALPVDAAPKQAPAAAPKQRAAARVSPPAAASRAQRPIARRSGAATPRIAAPRAAGSPDAPVVTAGRIAVGSPAPMTSTTTSPVVLGTVAGSASVDRPPGCRSPSLDLTALRRCAHAEWLLPGTGGVAYQLVGLALMAMGCGVVLLAGDRQRRLLGRIA